MIVALRKRPVTCRSYGARRVTRPTRFTQMRTAATILMMIGETARQNCPGSCVIAIEILLVEDNPDDLELALYALKKNNLANRIQIARDGEEALDFLLCRGPHSSRRFESPPRVVLLDLKLPKVDGLEVLRAIKNDPRAKPVPVVAMTSSKERKNSATWSRVIN